LIGYSGKDTTSTIASGALEMSNVDLAQEFTDMIITQRGFEANGKMITTSDQMLQTLINMRQ
jgi:flagellar hook protein FlgE